MTERLAGGINTGKTAAMQAEIMAWLAVHEHDPTTEMWLIGPGSTLRWDVPTQTWVPIPPPIWGQAQ